MPHISELKQSKFLTRSDTGKGILVTIKDCYQQDVAMEGDPQELKWCLSFVEDCKPMVLNTTNAQLIAAALGSEETEQWAGKKIVLFDDPTVMFKGKITGGIRARAMRVTQSAHGMLGKPANRPTPPSVATEPPEEDDVPF
jgi:hypothetical protein